MRTVIGLALAATLAAPALALASPSGDLQNMVAMYGRVDSVRVIEKFENGAVATVDVFPGGQYRIANAAGQDPALVLHIATAPIDGARWDGTFGVRSLGHKTIDGVPANGYSIAAQDGSFNETVWVNKATLLPMSSHVVAQGHTVDVTYGDYNNTVRVATP